MTSLRDLIPDFPRDIGTPQRMKIETVEQFIETVKKFNGTKRIFYSLYNRNNPVVDKVWFDFDSPQSYNNAKKMKDYCIEKNLKHMIVFSGGGFHFYIFAKSDITKPQKELLDRTHRYLAQQLNMTIGQPETEDIDCHIIGDIARIVTLPGTYNIRRKRWARSIPDSIFSLGLEAIHNYCRPNGGPDGKFRLFIYGENLFDFSEIKYKRLDIEMTNIKIEYEIKIDDERLQKICPPCIISMLVEKGCFKSRYFSSFYLKELGFSSEQINKIAEKYFSKFPRTDHFKNNYEQYCKAQGVLKQLFTSSKNDFCFPNCETLQRNSLCPGKCSWYPIQKKLYK